LLQSVVITAFDNSVDIVISFAFVGKGNSNKENWKLARLYKGR